MSGLIHFVDTLKNFTKTNPNDVLIVDPFSIGDVFQSLSIASTFCKLKGMKNINFICKHEALKVVEMFSIVKNLYINKHLDSLKIELLANTDWYKNQNNFFIMPPNMHLSLISETGRLDGNDMILKKKKISKSIKSN